MTAETASVGVEAVLRRRVCQRCRRPLDSVAYELRAADAGTYRCLGCALRYPRLVRRSLLISLVVGTLLVAINQGNVILGGDASAALAWKVPLTYAVPYGVATLGAILNARTKPPRARPASLEGGDR